MSVFNESVIEQAALGWFAAAGYSVVQGDAVSPNPSLQLRSSFNEAVLEGVLRSSIRRLNPELDAQALDDAVRKLLNVAGATLLERNRNAHQLLLEGVPVETRRPDGSIRGEQVRVVDFSNVDRNDWLAVSQFSMKGDRGAVRRPDIVLFLNGLPVAVLELKNAGSETATIWSAFNQLQTYQRDIDELFVYNTALVISDGVNTRMGSLSATRERFAVWRTITGESLAPTFMTTLEVMIAGVFDKRRFLDLLHYFVVFEDFGGGQVEKKIAGYHQYHAVNTAVDETLRAAVRAEVLRVAEPEGRYESGYKTGGKPGDSRVGVVWHTQGSGKSLTMAFYAGRIIQHPELENPTVVVITDRNDLDEQLFSTFARCEALLRQPPTQAADRSDLRTKLNVESGGVVFTTIQKFLPATKFERHPTLSQRRNIVVIADEAHRSQYDFVDGFARHMRDALPNASFVGFTGTPIEKTDANTRAVFGDYISVYDIQRAVQDGATVPIYYESRLAKLALNEAERPNIDTGFEEATEGEEIERKEKLKTKWAQLEAVVGANKRLELIAKDIVDHFERRLEAIDGKAMIVCMSRRICVDLYREIVRLRPEWHGADDDSGVLKVIMTGSASDPAEWQSHIRSKARREALANRYRDARDPFKLVIVRDMWLTGFDAPSMHTMYIDKPMRGHGLMQAIARVNRVFKDKPGGLVVDYLGLAHELKQALATYTESGGTGRTALNQDEAVAVMLEKHEVCAGLLHGFDWSKWTTGTPSEQLRLLPAAQEHILAQDNGKDRFVRAVRELSQAFALAVPHVEALRIRDDVAFFQQIQGVLAKRAHGDARPEEDIEHAVRQIISRAVTPDGVIDIFAAAGLGKPDISILSEEFLAEVRGMPQRNLAVELLQKLLKGELASRRRKNAVQARSFAEMLEQTLRRYQNRAIEAAQVIEELIGLARDMRAAQARGEALKLTEDEVAFYDALETNDSAVKVLGDDTLRAIAQELVKTVRDNVTIDWTLRENVRAQLRVLVKRILRKYGYPPDKQEKATETVLEQAALLSDEWAGA
jgi:type I restriction enzyme, R subunit